MLSGLVEEANRKGYSGYELCQLVNQRGIKCHINTFRQAVREREDRTKGQEAIYDLASSILSELPVRSPDRMVFSELARAAGFTVKQVWERYQETHEKKYPYDSFTCAVRRRMSPYEIALAREAERILGELAAERDGK